MKKKMTALLYKLEEERNEQQEVAAFIKNGRESKDMSTEEIKQYSFAIGRMKGYEDAIELIEKAYR